MNITIDTSKKNRAGEWCRAFAGGLRRHNVPFTEYVDYPSDLAIFWSAKRQSIIDSQIAHDGDYLILDHGYFGDRRHKFASANYNGLNGDADWKPENCPGDRWGKHGVEVKEWQDNEHGHVLIAEQKTNDASLYDMPEDWFVNIEDFARTMLKSPTRRRKHPLERIDGIYRNQSICPLIDDLRGAYCLVTWSSNSAVDAIISGIPAFAFGNTSMVKDVCSGRLMTGVKRPDRTQWLNDLAYRQWTKEEFENGDAWDVLKERYV